MITYPVPILPESATTTKPRKTKRSVFVMLQDVLQDDVVDGIEISSDLRICLPSLFFQGAGKLHKCFRIVFVVNFVEWAC